MQGFSFRRFLAVLNKETLEMRRDKATIGLTVMLPLIQLFLFGYALNANPRHLPTGVLAAEESRYTRDLEAALNNTGYFDLRRFSSEQQAEGALKRGEVLFVVNIPPGFTRDVDTGRRPSILMDADATDPTAIAQASAAVNALNSSAFQRDLPVALQNLANSAPFQVMVHARYNPEAITALNVVPALIGVILSFSTVVITALSMTREREAGTMENLLSMPVRPLEVMMGKIMPYVGLGYVQVFLILAVAVAVFGVPVHGSIPLLLAVLGLFIACNLALGFTFSTIARTQMQAQQMAQFVLLPSMMLSGFIYPFAGMPLWARAIGEVLPLTHIIRICRGILLKGNGFADILPDVWPMAVFAAIATTVAVLSYRETLD
jgi:ABC-type multidrug transport system permease subunit